MHRGLNRRVQVNITSKRGASGIAVEAATVVLVTLLAYGARTYLSRIHLSKEIWRRSTMKTKRERERVHERETERKRARKRPRERERERKREKEREKERERERERVSE